MKLVVTYDVNVNALEKEYREYLEYRKERLEYYEEAGDFLRKKRYEKNMPWMNFEEYIKKFCLEDNYIEGLDNEGYIYNCKMELKNNKEEV